MSKVHIHGIGWVPAEHAAYYQQQQQPPQHNRGGYGSPPNMPPQAWPPGTDARPDLNVQTYQSLSARNGMQWSIESVADPRPLIPVSPDGTVAQVFRTRTIRFTGAAAGQAQVNTLQFDSPSAIYARFGAAFNTQTNEPVDLAYFDVQFLRGSTGDSLDIDPGSATNLLGTAQRPAYIGGRAWMFDNGNAVQVSVRPRIPNLDIDITVWYVSFPGPDNYVASGGGQ